MMRKLSVLILTLIINADAMASSKRKAEDDDNVLESTKRRWVAFYPEKKNTHITNLDLSDDWSLTNIEFICFFSHLTDLNISNSPQLGDGYKPISQLVNLERLGLRGTELTTTKHLVPLVNLVKLSVTCPNIGKEVKHLSKLPNLRELWIGGDIKGIEKLSKLTSLEILDLRFVFNKDEAYGDNFVFPTLDFLSSLVSLRKLNLSSSYCIFYIKPIARLPQLTNLNLSGCPSIHDLRKLKRIKSLVKLNLGYVSSFYTPTINTDLTALTKLPNLRKLTIDSDEDIPTFPDQVRIHKSH